MGWAGHGGVRAMRARPETDGRPGAAPAGFAGLYERFFPDVHRYIAGRLGRDVADDIAADTFVIALRKHGSFDVTRGPARAWLFGIATNLVAQHRRTEQRRYRALGRAGTRIAWWPWWPRRECGRNSPGRWPGCPGRNATCCCSLPWRTCHMKRS